MSTSPSGLPNGQNQNGHPPPIIKRRVRGDPMVARKRPQPKGNTQRPAPIPQAAAPSARLPPRGHGLIQTPSPGPPGTPQPASVLDTKAKRAANGGWIDPAPPGAQDYKIVTTKRALRESMRYHVMRFSSTKYEQERRGIDPTNQDEFTRPVTLQRRDPRQPPPGREVREEAPDLNPVDEQEAERLAVLKSEREAQRAVEQAKSAPSLKDPSVTQKQKQKQEKKDNVQFYRIPRTEEQKKQSDLRYEEALPWHLEDADGKNVWVGSYVAPLSESAICFVAKGSSFHAIPLEKWYKFTAKPPFNTMRLEDAEKLMEKKVDPGRWFLRDQQKKTDQAEMEATRQYFHGPVRIKSESTTFRRAARGEKMDHDQIDVDGDEFQDDDEAPGFEVDNDEDTKDSAARVRRNMLGANLFGDADERRVEKEEEEERKEEEQREKLGKKTKKSLIKREKETIYQSDSDNPDYFASTESEDDSDAEKQGEQNKDDENSTQKQDSTEKGAAGSSSKGVTTPSGKQKQADALKKGKSLKRPGSPNLSESSGNESSRKKLKKQTIGSVQASRSSTPLPQGQAGQKTKLSMGSTSDGEATAGEMSDGQPRKKKLKLLGTGAKGTPVGSRAGSPIPPNTGSGAASPAKEGSPVPRAGSPGGPVEAWEIIQALPPLPNGITIGNLMKHFSSRVGENPGQMGKKDWIKLVKENCAYGPDKILRRKA